MLSFKLLELLYVKLSFTRTATPKDGHEYTIVAGKKGN